MKQAGHLSRRSFISSASGLFGSSLIASQWPAYLALASAACRRREAGGDFAHLDPHTAQTLEAVAEQIIPADDASSGAREAGVIWFIDEWLAGPGQGALSLLAGGADELDALAGEQNRFSELPFEEQTRALKVVENKPYFLTMRFLTLAGMFAMPRLGGNRERAGWEMIGFSDRHAWTAPFGYYDAVAADAANDENEV